MTQLRVTEDLQECQYLWDQLVPQERLFDFWGTRVCFQEQFNYRPYFLVAEEAGHPVGLAPLSWIDEAGCYGCFPGETWEGKTWVEQNRIVAPNAEILGMLLDNLPQPTRLRYLTRESVRLGDICTDVDEMGYLFYPDTYGCSLAQYISVFSGKARKKIERELVGLQALGVQYRYDYPEDVETLFNLNLMKYGPDSYFSSPRFYGAFQNLIEWLRKNGMLRITSVFLGDTLAAVDVGALFHRSYTLLAGGVHPEFPGVAKLINFHHLEYACSQQVQEVDFLCGDFGWKKRFHLSPRPLYAIRLGENQQALQTEKAETCKYA